jgi:hypothetical protein
VTYLTLARGQGQGRVRRDSAALAYRARSSTGADDELPEVPDGLLLARNVSAAARASGPGGTRRFDRCGAALLDAAIAAVFNAVTC